MNKTREKPAKQVWANFKEKEGITDDQLKAFQEYAIILSKNGQFYKSLEYYRKCLKVHPENEVFLFNLAVVFYKMNNIKKARFNLEKLLKINPENQGALELLKKIIGT